VDECAVNNGDCGSNVLCVNEPGTHHCHCASDGFHYDGSTCTGRSHPHSSSPSTT